MTTAPSGAFSPSREHDALGRSGDGARDRGVLVDVFERHQTGKDGGHQDVKKRADDERAEDADRNVAARILGFLGLRRDGVEAKVGEHHARGAGQHPDRDAASFVAAERFPEERHPAVAVRSKRPPVVRRHHEEPERDDADDHKDFHGHHEGVECRAFLDADDENDRDDRGDDDGGKVELESGAIEAAARDFGLCSVGRA